jgi:hypothetical protein
MVECTGIALPFRKFDIIGPRKKKQEIHRAQKPKTKEPIGSNT